MKQQKTTKKLEMVLLVLVIVLISAISFFGILHQDLNAWENVIPDYELGRELSKMRVLTFSVDDSVEEVEATETDETSVEVNQTVSDDEEISASGEKTEETAEKTVEVAVNPTEILTKENYDKTKKIIETRLAKAGITDNEIVVDYETGDFNIYVPFNDAADRVVDYVVSQGKVELVDTETGDLLVPSDMISSVKGYATISEIDENTEKKETTYDLGLQFVLTEDGVKKLNELSKVYIETKDKDGEATQKTLDVQIDGQTVYTTYFDPKGTYTDLIIPIYSEVAKEQYETYLESITIYENTINTGALPITYVANYTTYLENSGNQQIIKILVAGFVIALIALSIRLIIKNKSEGAIIALAEMGYIAVLSLLIRFAKEPLTLYSIVATFAISFVNYSFVNNMMKTAGKEYTKDLVSFVVKFMPLIIVAIVFVFATSIELKSIGTVLFWGLLTLVVYNLIFTKNLFGLYKKLKKGGNK